MKMSVADVTEDHVLNTARVERVFIKPQESRELIIRHRHIRADLFLLIPHDALIHRNRQRMAKLAHLRKVLLVGREPRRILCGVMLFEQIIPRRKECVLIFGRRLLLKEYRPGHTQRCLRKFLRDERKRIRIKIFEQHRLNVGARRSRTLSCLIYKREQIFLLFKKDDAAKEPFRFFKKRQCSLDNDTERTFTSDEKVDRVEVVRVEIAADILSDVRPFVCRNSYIDRTAILSYDTQHPINRYRFTSPYRQKVTVRQGDTKTLYIFSRRAIFEASR